MNHRSVVFALFTAACATSHGTVVGDSFDNSVLDVASLDVNGDGSIDTGDYEILEGLSIAARAKLGADPQPINLPLYKGMGKHTHASLLKLATQNK